MASPVGKEIRPTPAVAREALFNILGAWISDASVLDLFAGTGSVGFEALSRGAACATFVERLPEARLSIGETAEAFGLLEKVKIVEANAAGQVRDRIDPNAEFDLVYIDPPYSLKRPERILTRVFKQRLLSPGGYIVLERCRTDPLPEPVEFLVCLDTRDYGKTRLLFFKEKELKNSLHKA